MYACGGQAAVSSYWFSQLTLGIFFLGKIHVNILMKSLHCLCTWKLVINIALIFLSFKKALQDYAQLKNMSLTFIKTS